MPKCLIFDFDNTLARCTVDTDGPIIRILEGVLGRRISRSDWNAIDEFCSDYQLCKFFIKGKELQTTYQLVIEENIKIIEHMVYPPDLSEILLQLKKEYTLMIVSGRDQSSLIQSIKDHNLIYHFTDIVGDLPTRIPKPNPSLLFDLMEQHNLHPNDCIYIGDKESDYVFAKSAGCGFIASAWFKGKMNITKVKSCIAINDLPVIIREAFQDMSLDKSSNK